MHRFLSKKLEQEQGLIQALLAKHPGKTLEEITASLPPRKENLLFKGQYVQWDGVICHTS